MSDDAVLTEILSGLGDCGVDTETPHRYINVLADACTLISTQQAEIEGLRAERDEANAKFDAHIEAVKKWTTDLASYLPFMDDGKVTPQDFLVAAAAAQQWQGNLMERCTKAEAELALAAAKQEQRRREKEESGWVIEHEKSPVSAPVYWSGITWQPDHMKAIRFARKQDAEEVAVLIYGLEDDGHQHRICEHSWTLPAPPQADMTQTGDK